MPEERKLVTILFADVTGSTTLGERLDPEDVRALMGRYYDHARQIIAAHGGTLEKFIGDAVMAVFGLPVAHGDDAERALAAGVALRDAVAHDPILGGRLLLHTGINTGEVVTTSDPTSATGNPRTTPNSSSSTSSPYGARTGRTNTGSSIMSSICISTGPALMLAGWSDPGASGIGVRMDSTFDSMQRTR